MNQDNRRDNRRRVKHALMIGVAIIMMPLNQGCDIAKVMAAIGQLVQAISAPTGTAGTGTTTPQAGGTATNPLGALNNPLGTQQRPPNAVLFNGVY